MTAPAKPKPYNENSTITILNPERIPQAQDRVAEEFARIIEDRANKILREALKTQNGTETAG